MLRGRRGRLTSGWSRRIASVTAPAELGPRHRRPRLKAVCGRCSRRPYGKTPVVVVSHNPVEIPSHLGASVSCSSESPRALLGRLSAHGAEHVYVDGGNTIRGFLAESLIDVITITRVPVAIGDGIRLFDAVGEDVKLTHLHTTAHDFGFVQTTYRVERDA